MAENINIPVFKLHGEIGVENVWESELFGISGNLVSSNDLKGFLQRNKKADTIIIDIDSYGGLVDEAIVMYDLLRTSGKKVITQGVRVASAATIVFLAGDERLLTNNATFNIHFPYIESLVGRFDSEALQQLTEQIKAIDEKILNIYKTRLSLNDSDVEELKALMKADKDIGLQGALDWGFATGELKRNAIAFTSYHIKMLNKKQKQMKSKSILLKIKNMLEGVKAASVELSDGTLIYFEGETIEVNTAVFSDEALTTPLADGEYTLIDGRVIVVTAGVVSEIKDASQDAESAPSVEEVLSLIVNKLTSLEKELSTLKSAVGGQPVNKGVQANATKTTAKDENSFLKKLKSDLNK